MNAYYIRWMTDVSLDVCDESLDGGEETVVL